MSSTAIPGVFPPEEIHGQFYVDGGVVTHTPIAPLKLLMPVMDHITIISTAGLEREQTSRIKTDFNYLPTVVADLIGMVPKIDFLKFKYKNREGLYQEIIDELCKLVPPGMVSNLLQSKMDQMLAERFTHYPSTIIQPSQALSPTVRFHHEFTIPDMAHGRERAALALAA